MSQHHYLKWIISAILAGALWAGPGLIGPRVEASPADRAERAAGDTPFPNPSDLLAFTVGGHALGFQPEAMWIASRDHALRVEFVGANGVSPMVDSASPTPPDDSSSFHSPSSPFSSVTYPNLWDGVTLTYDAPAGAILRSTYRLDPHAGAGQIRLRYNAPVEIEADGSLLVTYPTGQMRESPPVAWQDIAGARVSVAVAFNLLGQNDVGVQLGRYDPRHPLTIDPTLTWNTFLGGTGFDQGHGIAVDSSGNAYVVGSSSATWGAPVRAFASGDDAFVAKLDPNGTLVWHTFLGGTGSDYGFAITVDASGSVYVAGDSSATWGAPVRAYVGGNDAFAAKLNAATGVLGWSTFLGGSGTDSGRAIAVNGSGNGFVAGYSNTTWGTPARPYASNYDAFAVKLNSNTGTLTWNSFLGGTGLDVGAGIAVDGSDKVYVTGNSEATWGTPVAAYVSNTDALVAKLTSTGTLTWNTFLLGGSEHDYGNGVVVDGSGNVYVTGNGEISAYVVKLNSNGGVTWNTPVADWATEGNAIALDNSTGYIYVTGVGFDDNAFNYEPYAAMLMPNNALLWSAFFGGDGFHEGLGVAVNGNGYVYAAGYSDETWGSPVRPFGSNDDAFAIRLLPRFVYLPLVVR